MQWHFADHHAEPGLFRLRIGRLLQFRVSRLMLAIAMSAILFSAWMFNRQYLDSQRAWTTSQIAALGERDAARRRQAAENLHVVDRDDLARTIVVLTCALADADWQVRHEAARSLASAIGSSGGINNRALFKHIDLAANTLATACDDPRGEVRLMAIQALGKIYDTPRIPPTTSTGSVTPIVSIVEARRASETLWRALEDPSGEVRAQALWSYARVGRICGAGADEVKEMAIVDPDRKVRIAALDALRVGWAEDPRLYFLLLERLKVVSDQEEHAHICWAIGGLGPPLAETLPALIAALSVDDPVQRYCIPIALGKLGPVARSALPALSQLAQREIHDQDGRCPAIEAIRLIDPSSGEAQALIEPLADLIRDSPSELQRQKAMFQLIGFGPSAAQAVGPLRDALKSTTLDVKQRAIVVLGFIGPAARFAIADLDRLIHDDPDLTVRHAGEQAMSRIKASMQVSAGNEP